MWNEARAKKARLSAESIKQAETQSQTAAKTHTSFIPACVTPVEIVEIVEIEKKDFLL